MRVGVVRFPGTNCETETVEAVERAGGTAEIVDYRSSTLSGCDAVILPGGFSYGDYLRSGAIARFAPIMSAVRDLAESGALVLGICNGFQVLCEAHLLPGALLHNDTHRFAARPVDIRVERRDTPVTTDFDEGEVIRIPQAHGEGRFVADPETLASLETGRQVIFRYVAVPGSDAEHNPNGSVADIAGICNARGNVIGFMPHPERLADTRLGSDAGHRVFTSFVRYCALGSAT